MGPWHRGDCHTHSVRSDGELTPAQLAAAARAAGLDLIAATEHNTAAAHDVRDGAGLLVILGEEVTTRTGHWLALGLRPGQVVDWRYGALDGVLDRHLAEVHDVGGLCVAAHPHAPYPTGRFDFPYDGFDAVEVWNGPWSSDLAWQADNEAALAEWARGLAAGVRAGRWRPAVGNSDTHLPGQIGIPHTVVRAGALTTAEILAGLRAGHSWIAGSPGIDLSCTVTAAGGTATFGERLDTGGGPVTLRVSVLGVPGGILTVHTGQGTAHREPLPANGSVEWHATAATFVRVEVRHPDGRMAALGNPVILT